MTMMDGNCRSIRLALITDDPLTTAVIAKRWAAVPNFDKMFAGTNPPNICDLSSASDELVADIESFTQYYSLDVIVPSCHRASAHRVFLIQAPPGDDKAVIYRGLLDKARGSIVDGVDGVMLFFNASRYESDDAGDKHLISVLNECEAANCHVLLFHQASRPPNSAVLEKLSSFDPDSAALEKLRSRFSVKRLEHPRSEVNDNSTLRKMPYTSLITIDDLKAMKEEERDAVLAASSGTSAMRVSATIRFVASGGNQHDRETFVEMSHAFVSLVNDVHNAVIKAEDHMSQLRAAFDAQQKAEFARKHPVALPAPNQVSGTMSWLDSHVPDASRSFDIVLSGAPNTGKTTLVTAVADGFILREHIPTDSVEIAHLSVNLGGGGTNAVDPINITVFDGVAASSPSLVRKTLSDPSLNTDTKANSSSLTLQKRTVSSLRSPITQNLHAQRAPQPLGVVLHTSILLTFLDVSDPYGVERWRDALHATQARLPTSPSFMGILAVKNDVSNSSLYSTQTLADLAGEHDAFFEYIDPRNAAADRTLLARVVAHVLIKEEDVKVNLERQRLIHAKVPNEIPHTETDITMLFHAVDVRGTGFITIDEARSILESCTDCTIFSRSTFDSIFQYVAKNFGPIARSRDESRTPLISKDQFGLMLCRIAKL